MTPSLSEMVTDGANRVGPRREATPEAAVCFTLAAALTVFVLRARRSRGVVGGAAVGVLASAAPGFSTLVNRRADSPAETTLSATSIEKFQTDVEAFSNAHECAVVVWSTCTACDPTVDFALATTSRCAAPAPIVLGADALTAGCITTRGTLACGSELRP